MEEENAIFLAAFAENRQMSMPTERPPTTRPPQPKPTERPPTARPPQPQPTQRPPTARPPSSLPPTIPNVCNLTPEQRRNEITAELSKISNPSDFADQSSPQRQALDFIIDDDPLQLCPKDRALVQRYISVVFYYSTDGPNWSECSSPTDVNDPVDVAEANAACNIGGDGSQFAGSDAWLTGVSECQWGGITCDVGESVVSIFFGECYRCISLHLTIKLCSLCYSHLTPSHCIRHSPTKENNNLGGTLPYELQDLETLKALHVEEGRTAGVIPEEYGNIKTLEELDLNFNQLTGTIPDSIYRLNKLVELDLNDNRLEGTINPAVGNMPNLQFFQLQNNRIEGTVPAEMGRLARLVIFNTDENRLTGLMPQRLCDRRDINGGRLASLTADCLNPDAEFYIQCDTPDCCTMCF